MSNRVRPQRRPILDQLRRLDGATIPGGCHSCHAEQTVTAPAFGNPNVARITIHHDPWCPDYARRTTR